MPAADANNGKLGPYLDAICYAHARGSSVRKVGELLSVGLIDAAGVRLAGVSAHPSSIRERLASPAGKKILAEYRRQLYGEPYAQPLAHSGRRLQALSDALEVIEGEPCEHCGRGGAPGAKVSELVRLIREARAEEQAGLAGSVVPVAATEPPAGHQRPIVNRGVIVNVLADGLAELARTGHAGAVLEAIKGTGAFPQSTREGEGDPPPSDRAAPTTYMGTVPDREEKQKIPEVASEAVVELESEEVESVVEVEGLEIFGDGEEPVDP